MLGQIRRASVREAATVVSPCSSITGLQHCRQNMLIKVMVFEPGAPVMVDSVISRCFNYSVHPNRGQSLARRAAGQFQHARIRASF